MLQQSPLMCNPLLKMVIGSAAFNRGGGIATY